MMKRIFPFLIGLLITVSGSAWAVGHGVLFGNTTQTTGVSSLGTSGQVLTSNGDGSDPSFQDTGGVVSPTTLTIPHSTTLPATCSVGQSYMDTDATSGQRWYLCESTDTWAVQGGTTTIVGITGTKAQFNTALSDGDFVYQSGDAGTPSALVLTNATLLPIAGITGLGTSVGTALGVNIGSAGGICVGGASCTSPTFVTPILGTPTSGTLTNTTGYTIANLSGAGTGVLTALQANVGSAGGPVTFNGAGGTPSSMTGTNITGIPTSGITNYGTGLGEATATGLVVTDASAAGLEVGPNGATNPVLRVVDNTASQNTGLSINGGSSIITLTQIGGTNPQFQIKNSGSGGFNHADSSGNSAVFITEASSKLSLQSDGVFAFSNDSTNAGQASQTMIDSPAAAQVRISGSAVGTTKGSLAITADANGGTRASNSSTEQLTLSTGATTTATSGNLAPANGQIEAILVRVTTTITTAVNYGVKVTGGNAFCLIGTANTTTTNITANTTDVWVPCAHADQYNTSATTLTVTTNANPGAGVLRITTVYKTYTAPTS